MIRIKPVRISRFSLSRAHGKLTTITKGEGHEAFSSFGERAFGFSVFIVVGIFFVILVRCPWAV